MSSWIICSSSSGISDVQTSEHGYVDVVGLEKKLIRKVKVQFEAYSVNLADLTD